MGKTDWELIQSFNAVAQAGSLSKAALILGTSQPTLSRQIARLEQQLGITLFDRSTQGLRLSGAGSKLVESSEAMAEAASQFSRLASGSHISLEGNIRLSANEVIGLYYLPAIITAFGQRDPKVNVELDISNSETSLSKRDADIALRMFRPSQAELVARRLPDITLRVVASEKYLQAHPEPANPEELAQHNLIGFDRDIQFVDAIKSLGWPVEEKDFNSRTDFLPLQIELARTGAGISVTHEHLIQKFPELKMILPDLHLPKLPFWLVCHADVQHNRRIRVLMDFLAEQLGTLLNQQ